MWLRIYADHECQFEIWALETHAEAFESTFGYALQVKAVVRKKRRRLRSRDG